MAYCRTTRGVTRGEGALHGRKKAVSSSVFADTRLLPVSPFVAVALSSHAQARAKLTHGARLILARRKRRDRREIQIGDTRRQVHQDPWRMHWIEHGIRPMPSAARHWRSGYSASHYQHKYQWPTEKLPSRCLRPCLPTWIGQPVREELFADDRIASAQSQSAAELDRTGTDWTDERWYCAKARSIGCALEVPARTRALAVNAMRHPRLVPGKGPLIGAIRRAFFP
jgi:hypothetical protein